MMDTFKVHQERSYTVTKANEIIQRARFDLTMSELKLLSYILSKIKPTDTEFYQYEFTVNDYCRVIGKDINNGKNLRNIKKTLSDMEGKGFWLTREDGKETSIRWINKTWIDKGSGKIRVRLDDDIQRYVVGLYSDFTQYSLLAVLPMTSSYSMRIYELLKSYAYQGSHTFDIDDLKRKLGADSYVNFKDFRKRVIELAVREINLYTDIEVSWEPIMKGRKVIQVLFHIAHRDVFEQIEVNQRANRQIDGQLTMDL